jgi:hypothetical protein
MDMEEETEEELAMMRTKTMTTPLAMLAGPR